MQDIWVKIANKFGDIKLYKCDYFKLEKVSYGWKIIFGIVKNYSHLEDPLASEPQIWYVGQKIYQDKVQAEFEFGILCGEREAIDVNQYERY